MTPDDTQGSATARVEPVRHVAQAVRSMPPHAHSPVDLVTAPISGRWKTLILWQLYRTDGTVRFSDLLRAMPGLTPRMLARQLRELEGDGLVYREVWPVVPPRVDYGLTERGESLRPVLDAMCRWGKANGWTGVGFD